MVLIQVAMTQPKINIVKHGELNVCRCVVAEITVNEHDVIALQFETLDDARALNGLLSLALEK